MRLHALSLIACAMLVQGCASYKTISQETVDATAIDDRVVLFTPTGDGRDDGKGAVPHLKALGAPPKRVALVTFSVKSNAKKGDQVITSLSDGGASKVATAMAAKSVATIKEVFKANGMDVLEPSEYLTDDAKKEFYRDFTVKVEGSAALLSGVMSTLNRAGSGADPGEGVANGYTSLDDITNTWRFSSVSNSIGADLTKGLGVDAVLLVTNEVGAERNQAWLQNVRMYLFGPNPVALKDEDIGTGMFKDNRSGHIYAGTMIKKGFKNVYILPKENESLQGLDDEKNYEGYEKITRSLASVVAGTVKAKTTEK